MEMNEVTKNTHIESEEIDIEKGIQEDNSDAHTKLVEPCEIGPLTERQRREVAFGIREEAALFQKNLPLPGHQCNGDEDLYANKIGSYSKALPHNKLGEVDINAYRSWTNALTSGNYKNFETIPLGGVAKFANPQAAYAYDLTGPDSHHLSMSAAPAFNSAWIASEMAEVYWQALTRDIPFIEYDSNTLTLAAASDLSKFTDFRGPKDNGRVTTATLFRGNTPGDLKGPYISQFLWRDIPFGARVVSQRYRTTVAGDDYMTLYDEWLDIQNGGFPSSSNKFDSTYRYIRNGRDLGEWVHRDFTFQGVLDACLIILGFGPEALAVENPYLCSKTQTGFITFGAVHILDLVCHAARVAMEAAWFQKFLVHRRLRPEEFGGRVNNNLMDVTKYPINPEILNSKAVFEVYSTYGSYLLPMAYPEGCPTHTAYPAGHACIAGAGVTMLKAFFNESFIIPKPVIASRDGQCLLPYSKGLLTVGGELNKLAYNISLGRDFAGVHWRSDGSEGLKLGETVAIGILQDYRRTFNEEFSGFSFTKFDGTTIII